MAERTFISFDWAIKKVLRHKENFSVLEGFISEVLGFDVKIETLLESEGNKETEHDKFNRVDILVRSAKEELMLIEVQYDDEEDYFHRMVYGISKLITEYISEGQGYGAVKKAYSINIVYFTLGQGKDSVYEYVGKFVGRKEKDILLPSTKQKQKYKVQGVSDIFPQYYILRVGEFKEDKVEDTMDEWLYFLKKSSIKDEFKAKGLEEAKKVLDYHNMLPEDQAAYKRHIENRRIEMGVLETARDEGKREGKKEGEKEGIRRKAIEVAKKLLAANSSLDFIVQVTELSLSEVEKLANGEGLEASNIS